TYPVHYEGLLGRVVVGVLLEPEADQQIRAETHPFPPNKHQQKVVGKYQREHREHEEVQIRKEPPVTLVAPHIPGRENVDPERDERDEQDVDHRERIQQEREVSSKVANVDPRE